MFEADFRSLLCSSIRHSSFENVIDGFLSSDTKPTSMITELTHEANLMSKVVPSKWNVNFQMFNESSNDKKSTKKQNSKKKSKWWE